MRLFVFLCILWFCNRILRWGECFQWLSVFNQPISLDLSMKHLDKIGSILIFRFVFLCNRWLAVEEDDGMVERVLPVAGLADLTAFNHLFGSSVRKKLTNDHLWFSVISRPTKSSFTRVQRVSCCVSLLFLTMITNCMFFKSDEKVLFPTFIYFKSNEIIKLHRLHAHKTV